MWLFTLTYLTETHQAFRTWWEHALEPSNTGAHTFGVVRGQFNHPPGSVRRVLKPVYYSSHRCDQTPDKHNSTEGWLFCLIVRGCTITLREPLRQESEVAGHVSGSKEQPGIEAGLPNHLPQLGPTSRQPSKKHHLLRARRLNL